MPNICDFWTLIITTEIATQIATQLPSCLLVNCHLFFHKLSMYINCLFMYISGLAAWHTGQPGAQLWHGENTHVLVRGGALENGQKAFKRKDGAAVWKVREENWWELFLGMEARGEDLVMEEELPQKKLIWEKRMKLIHCFPVAAGELTSAWHDAQANIKLSHLVTSASLRASCRFLWSASKLTRPTYFFTANTFMWLPT